MLTLQEIAQATDGELHGDPNSLVNRVSTDSRTIQPGELYVALIGERFDGHQFIPQLEGKNPIVYSHGEAQAPSLKVTDTLQGYGRIANAWRRKWGGKVVAITGSSGKTSTKEWVAWLLAQSQSVHKTQANHNNEIGLPQTLLGLRETHALAVVEMGMRGPGEIRALAKIAEPDIGIITNIGKAHIGRLGSQEAIAQAKGELFEELNGGLAIANGDDPLALALNPTLTYGLGENCQIRATEIQEGVYEAAGCRFTLPDPGIHHVYNALAAIACAVALRLPLPEKLDFPRMELGGRAQVSEWQDIHLHDETYNANPDSMRAAMGGFFKAPGRHVVVLGEMGELGDASEQEHLELGRYLSQYSVSLLVTLGETAALYGRHAGCPHQNVATPEEAAEVLRQHLAPGDRVLFKGSRSAKIEQVLKHLQGSHA